ncbi:MAG: hypothetical protein CSA76_03495 [Spirochaetales bacterium]|nr:MAG: hypothetical protein CSA76_03495 [Spirochaetales bacterium]
MTDMFDKCATDAGYFGRFRAAGDRFFTLPVIDDLPGPHMKFQGQDNIMWSVNNYIGLAGNEEIKQAALEATEKWSVSSPMGSRMMSGSTSQGEQRRKTHGAFLPSQRHERSGIRTQKR